MTRYLLPRMFYSAWPTHSFHPKNLKNSKFPNTLAPKSHEGLLKDDRTSLGCSDSSAPVDGQETAAIWTQSLDSHTHLSLGRTLWAQAWQTPWQRLDTPAEHEAAVPAFVELTTPQETSEERASHTWRTDASRSGDGGRGRDPAEAPRGSRGQAGGLSLGQAPAQGLRGRGREQVPRRSGELGSKGPETQSCTGTFQLQSKPPLSPGISSANTKQEGNAPQAPVRAVNPTAHSTFC